MVLVYKFSQTANTILEASLMTCLMGRDSIFGARNNITLENLV